VVTRKRLLEVSRDVAKNIAIVAGYAGAFALWWWLGPNIRASWPEFAQRIGFDIIISIFGFIFTVLMYALFVCLAIAVAVAWWWLPVWLVNRKKLKFGSAKMRAEMEDNYRKTLGQGMGGIALLLGAAFTYYQLRTTVNQAEATAQISKDVLISQEVSRGFEQLGSDKILVRLGGIYALEGVMTASSRYRQAIMGALCSLVIESSSRSSESDNAPIPADAHAALVAIGRRSLSLSATDIVLAGASAKGARLSNINLAGADLTKANFSHAVLIRANLSRATLTNAALSGADMSRSYLSGANFSSANLHNANLSDVLSGVWPSILQPDNAFSAVSAWSFSDLRNSYQSGPPAINFYGSDLSGANLTNATLINANLASANLVGAILLGSNLESANLSDADLSDTIIEQNQLDKACGNAATRLPAGRTIKNCYKH
jgi:uncharacterized protein YjbI with pentapeptide repeats